MRALRARQRAGVAATERGRKPACGRCGMCDVCTARERRHAQKLVVIRNYIFYFYFLYTIAYILLIKRVPKIALPVD